MFCERIVATKKKPNCGYRDSNRERFRKIHTGGTLHVECSIMISDNVEPNINPLNFIGGDKYTDLKWICMFISAVLGFKQLENFPCTVMFVMDVWKSTERLYVYRTHGTENRHVHSGASAPSFVCPIQSNALWKSMNLWNSSIKAHIRIDMTNKKKTFA